MRVSTGAGINPLLWSFAACLLASPIQAATAHKMVAVLSSDLAPYEEAFNAFQQHVGNEVPKFILPRDAPVLSGVSVVVAFGGKASLGPYPGSVTLVSCLAPALKTEDLQEDSGVRVVRILALPRPEELLAFSRRLLPTGTRLAVLWSGEGYRRYINRLTSLGDGQGMHVLSQRVADSRALPETLRALLGHADAIWMPPDPVLLTAENFSTVRDFSLANKIPFYAPMRGLVDQGAAASVAPDFKRVGETAAAVAQEVLQGQPVEAEILPEASDIVLNRSALAKSGLTPSDDLVHDAADVLP